MKSEPHVYSYDDLVKDGSTPWDGVRNYQARNFMRDKMRIGDMVLYYHSNTKPPHIAGISRICKESYSDITQFDEKSKFDEIVTLDQLKDNSVLEGMLVIKRGQRLSVQPVEKQHFDEVCRMVNIHL
jgi:predicted RNA-binding protein with PUA-like domain